MNQIGGYMKRDYYEALGLPKKASPNEIKRAYRKLALRYHPDRRGSDNISAARFREIEEAYRILINPALRNRYDTNGFSDEDFLEDTISVIFREVYNCNSEAPGDRPREPCRTCMGKGRIQKPNGFFTVTTTCKDCAGSGFRKVEFCVGDGSTEG